MSRPNDLPMDMERAPAAHAQRTAGRLIEELHHAPEWDDPAELAAVADVLGGLTVEPLPSEQGAAEAMAAQMAATLRHAGDQPPAATPGRRHRARVAAILVAASMAATTGLAAADVLPDPVQRLASDVLDRFGLSVPRPGPDGQPGAEPGPGTSRPVDIDGHAPPGDTPTPDTTDEDRAPVADNTTVPTGTGAPITPGGTPRTSTTAGDNDNREPSGSGGTHSLTDPATTGSPDSGSARPGDPVADDAAPTYPPPEDPDGAAPDSSWPDTASPESTTPSYDDPAPTTDSEPSPTTEPGTSSEPAPQPTEPGTEDGGATGYGLTTETTSPPESPADAPW